MDSVPDEVSSVEEMKEISMNVLENSTMIDAEEYKKRLDDYLGKDVSGIKGVYNQFL
jgi:hypothetical protein